MSALHLPACLATACAASQPAGAVAAAAPGFWLGLWHGLIFPLAWIVSLFAPSIAIFSDSFCEPLVATGLSSSPSASMK